MAGVFDTQATKIAVVKQPGYSAARLAYLFWEQEVAGSNPATLIL